MNSYNPSGVPVTPGRGLAHLVHELHQRLTLQMFSPWKDLHQNFRSCRRNIRRTCSGTSSTVMGRSACFAMIVSCDSVRL